MEQRFIKSTDYRGRKYWKVRFVLARTQNQCTSYQSKAWLESGIINQIQYKQKEMISVKEHKFIRVQSKYKNRSKPGSEGSPWTRKSKLRQMHYYLRDRIFDWRLPFEVFLLLIWWWNSFKLKKLCIYNKFCIPSPGAIRIAII